MRTIPVGTWSDWKSTCLTTKGLSGQFSDAGDRYNIWATDQDGTQWEITILKGSSDATDFEASFKASFNGRINFQQLDSDGASMSRNKVCPSGWSFNFRGLQFQLSTLGSVVNQDYTGAALTDATLYLYDASGAVITDPGQVSNCVKTVVDFEPAHDYYISGGMVDTLTQASQHVYAHAVGAPDIPYSYGGSRPFIQNVDVSFHPAGFGIAANAQEPKLLPYSATVHSGKLRFIFMHPAGFQLPMNIELETFTK